MVVWVEPTKQ